MRKWFTKARRKVSRRAGLKVEALEPRMVLDGQIEFVDLPAIGTELNLNDAPMVEVLPAPTDVDFQILEMNEFPVDEPIDIVVVLGCSGSESVNDDEDITDSTGEPDTSSLPPCSSENDSPIYTLEGDPDQEGGSTVTETTDSDTGITLSQLDTAADIEHLLLTTALEQYDPIFGKPVWFPVWQEVMANAPDASGDFVLYSSPSDSRSDTNVQVSGVDEGDNVETDGEFIYVAREDTLDIIDVRDNGHAETIFSHTLNGMVQALLLHEKRLFVVSAVDSLQATNSNFDRLLRPRQVTSQTLVTIFDVADAAHPVVVQQTTLDGSLVATRAIDNNVYVILSNTPALPAPQYICSYEALDPVEDRENNDHEPDEDSANSALSAGMFLPWGRNFSEYQTCTYETREEYIARVQGHLLEEVLPQVTNGDLSSWLTAPEDIYFDVESQVATLISVAQFDISSDEPGPVATTTVQTGYGSKVYATTNSFYVLTPEYEVVDEQPAQNTTILKFNLGGDPSPIQLVAQGSVPGRTLNQFSVDEYNGYLRVATTSGWFDHAANGVYLLHQVDDALSVVGSVEDLAPGENIFAVRFMGDLGYVVTFRQIDPLFALDLSDPVNPTVEGELKVPGFSNYLHPIGEDLLIGVGQEFSARWNGTDLLVSLFVVSNPSAPQSIDRFLHGLGDGYSAAFQDHHAIKYFEDVQILAVPATIGSWGRGDFTMEILVDADGVINSEQNYQLLLFKIDPTLGEDSVQLFGSIEADSPILNSVKIGDIIYAIAGRDVQLLDVTQPQDPPVPGLIGGIANRDWFGVERTAQSQPLDVMRNDFVGFPDGPEWKVVEVTSTTGGGAVTIAEEGLAVLYTPPADVSTKDDSFEYVLRNNEGQKAKARVWVGIHDPLPDNNDDRQRSGERMAERARLDLAARLEIRVEDIHTVLIEFQIWPDACLGAPQPEEGCAQIDTPGFHIVLAHDWQRFIYHTDLEERIILVQEDGPIPAAIDDDFPIEADSKEKHLDVLANDFPGIDFFRTLIISAVTTPDQGGVVTIGQGGFDLIYSPADGFTGEERFEYTVGSSATAEVTVHVSEISNVVDIRLDITDLEGNPITAVTVGEEFIVNIYVDDLREIEEEIGGVFASYLDLLYSSQLASIVGDIQFGEQFPNGRRGEMDLPGLIGNLGAFAGIEANGMDETLLASITFTATNRGELEIESLAAEETSVSQTVLFGEDQRLPLAAVNFAGAVLEVVDSFTNSEISEDVNGDHYATAMDALILVNDINEHQSRRLTHQRRNRHGGQAEAPQVYFMDPSGDGYLSPIDIVLVVMRVNELTESVLRNADSVTGVTNSTSNAGESSVDDANIAANVGVVALPGDDTDTGTAIETENNLEAESHFEEEVATAAANHNRARRTLSPDNLRRLQHIRAARARPVESLLDDLARETIRRRSLDNARDDIFAEMGVR